MLMPSELSATALLRSCRSTSSGTMACQLGAIKAAPMPPRKVSATSEATDCSPVADSSIRQMLTPASRNWMAMSSLRRSRMSASTPAGIASRKIGRVAAACTRATAAGEGERSVISQALATSRMKLPVLPMMVAAQSTANSVCRSGARPPAGVSPAGLMAAPPGSSAWRQACVRAGGTSTWQLPPTRPSRSSRGRRRSP